MSPSSIYQEEAHELIRVYLSCPVRYSELVAWVESERTGPDCNWTRIKDFWTHEFKHSPRPLEGSNYVEGIGRVYKGAAYYQEKAWDKALKHFGLADQAFSYENDSFRLALTCMAQGLSLRAANNRAEARDHFIRAKEPFESLSHQYWILRERVRADQCKALCGKLDDLIDELKPSGYFRPRAHMIPAICDGTTDQALWFTAGQPTTEMVMLGKQYRLLALSDRHVLSYRFNALENYFVVDAQDDCMINASIHSNDRLLVRHSSTRVDSGVLVVQVEERDGSHHKYVRKMHYDGEFLVLVAANTKCPTRRFRTSAAVVDILGEVAAIMEPIIA